MSPLGGAELSYRDTRGPRIHLGLPVNQTLRAWCLARRCWRWLCTTWAFWVDSAQRTIENQPPETPSALRGLGASRAKIYFNDLVPNAMPRWLVYFFYRWETCVREAAIIGMLGVSSFGYFIFKEARPRDLYDVMIYFTLLGAALVFVADLISALIRWRLRRSSLPVAVSSGSSPP